ncbi:Metallo-hydrolase oxidoreductase [Coniophora puteana RWD-64-598 SS2]|uniref:Metallo-hydrolase oxidoreductase n=1 Tax=Coniophora puteana (strain RWD-64-598) TaxID=741705 RepID=A0A5M3MVK6_CONPW|nr:Metallo-hydrolase oxidoreductase [Coniophora puteana RWD-64-598 SS2]EIW83080.1 Metallo-hydrolase oxidoreductase [Coniophora puteana RWD-64-598 SS2]
MLPTMNASSPLSQSRLTSPRTPLAIWSIRYTPLGSDMQSGYLVQLPTAKGCKAHRVIFDPIFAQYAYPSNIMNGLARRLPPPCSISQLPEIDFVVVSHNHYDHCDLEALSVLWKRSKADRPIKFLVPLGLKSLLMSAGIPKSAIVELDWWDSVAYPCAGGQEVTLACTPCQHTSGRGVFDQKGTLWSSWVVQQKSPDSDLMASVYHAGDTGYQTAAGPCPAFKEIGDKYGPFDLAMIPIWRGASLSFVSSWGYKLSDDSHLATTHASPEDAVLLTKDIRARHSLAMHFATWAGSDHEAFEPQYRLIQARSGDWHEEGGFGVIDIGESVVISVARPDTSQRS